MGVYDREIDIGNLLSSEFYFFGDHLFLIIMMLTASCNEAAIQFELVTDVLEA